MSRINRPDRLPVSHGSLAVQMRPQRFASLMVRFEHPSFTATGADLWLRADGNLAIVGRSSRLPAWLDASLEAEYRAPLAALAKRIEAFATAFDRASESGGIGLPFVSIGGSEFSRGVVAGIRFGGVGAGTASYQLLEDGSFRLNVPARTVGSATFPLHPNTARAARAIAASFGPEAVERIERLLRPMAERELPAFKSALLALPTELLVRRS
jgi:hypothetical protein